MLLEGQQLDSPAAPLDDLLRVGLDAAPDEVAIVSSQRALSWRQLDRAGAALAAFAAGTAWLAYHPPAPRHRGR